MYLCLYIHNIYISLSSRLSHIPLLAVIDIYVDVCVGLLIVYVSVNTATITEGMTIPECGDAHPTNLAMSNPGF